MGKKQLWPLTLLQYDFHFPMLQLCVTSELFIINTKKKSFTIFVSFTTWQAKLEQNCCRYSFVKLMQSSMGTFDSPSSRIVKDSTLSRRWILRCLNFGIGESSPNLFLNMVNLYLVRSEARWILNEWAFYCFIIFFIWKWILTLKNKLA